MEGIYSPPDAWIDITLNTGCSVYIHPGDEELIRKSVDNWKKKYNGELIITISSDEVLELRRLEGGIACIPVSHILFWTIITPEEWERLCMFRSYLNSVAEKYE